MSASFSILDNRDNVKAIRIAFFNSISLMTLATTILLLITIYGVLKPFFGALVWATLFGVFLFPAKFCVASWFTDMLSHPKYKKHSLIYDLLLAPCGVLRWLFVECVISTITRHNNAIFVISLLATLLRQFSVIGSTLNQLLAHLLTKDVVYNMFNCLFHPTTNHLDFFGAFLLAAPMLYWVLLNHFRIAKAHRHLVSITILLINDLFLQQNIYLVLMVVGFVIFEWLGGRKQIVNARNPTADATETESLVDRVKPSSRSSVPTISPTKDAFKKAPETKHNLNDTTIYSSDHLLPRNNSFSFNNTSSNNNRSQFAINPLALGTSTIFEDSVKTFDNYVKLENVLEANTTPIRRRSRFIRRNASVDNSSATFGFTQPSYNNPMVSDTHSGSNFNKKFSLLLDSLPIASKNKQPALTKSNVETTKIFGCLIWLLGLTLFYKYEWLCPLLWTIVIVRCVWKLLFDAFAPPLQRFYESFVVVVGGKVAAAVRTLTNQKSIDLFENKLLDFLIDKIHSFSTILIIAGFMLVSVLLFLLMVLKLRIELVSLIHTISKLANFATPSAIIKYFINTFAPQYIDKNSTKVHLKPIVDDIDQRFGGDIDQMLNNYIGINITTFYDFYNSNYENASRFSPKIDSLWSSRKSLFDLLQKIYDSNNLKESIGGILTKITPLYSVAAYLFYHIFASGHLLITYSINIVVFLTALYILLSASRHQYSPIQLIDDYSGVLHLGNAIGCSINDIFGAALKMMLFYGVYFWCTHTLFHISIVYIPTVLACALAVLPFANISIASLPALFDLYFVQSRSWVVLCVFYLIHCIPSYIVDPVIYGEIASGGHPYLTGLMICGGIYYYGVAGTIIGPTLLCSLIVIYRWIIILSEAISCSALRDSVLS